MEKLATEMTTPCGHPEVPVHGYVWWFNTTAIYWCETGYQLDPSGYSTRICVNGKWTWIVPHCTKSTGKDR
jgi:hypothetical protein